MLQIIVSHIDWLGVFFSLLGWFIMARNRFYALLILCCSNIVWLTWSIKTNVLSLGFLSISFMLLNMRTIYEWIKSEKVKPIEFQDKSYLNLKKLLNKK